FCMYAIILLLWLIRNRSELIASFYPSSGSTSSLIVSIICMTASSSGLILAFICEKMAKRQKAALKWFFVVWPINFFSEMFIGVSSVFEKYPTWLIGFLAVTFFGIFLASILFYLNDSIVNSLFENRGKVGLGFDK
ncbi:MAG: hypothetical protein ACREC8_02480, partial [Limisphaerales bacterium]